MNSITASLIKASKNKDAAPILDCSLYGIVGYISTGSLMLDGLLSGRMLDGGLAKGRLVELTGYTATAKSFVMTGTMLNHLKKSPNHYCVFFESEMSLIQEQMKPLMTKSMNDRCPIFPIRYHEEIIHQSAYVVDQIESIILKHEKEGKPKPQFLITLDSLGMLVPQQAVKNAISGSDKKVMNEQQLIKAFFNQIKTPCMRIDIPFLFINHIYTKIGGGGGFAKVSEVDSKITRGGQGVMFAPDAKIRLTKKSYREQESPYKRLGIRVQATATKSRFIKEYSEVSFELLFDSGLDKYSGIWPFLVDNGYITTQSHGNKGNSYHIEELDWNMTKSELESLNSPEELFTKPILKYADKCFRAHFAMNRDDGKPKTVKKEEPPKVEAPAIEELL